MKRRTGVTFGCIAALALAAGLEFAAPAAAQMPDPWLQENAALDGRFVQALMTADIDGIMACFSASPDVQLIHFGKIVQGPAAIRQHFVETTAPGAISGANFNVRYWRSGEFVFAVGTVEITVNATGAKFIEVWSDVRRKEKGKWVYLIDHAAIVPPAS